MADKETVIGPETRISGEVRGDEDLIVRGRIEGKIQLTQTLTVDEGGIVQADVDVRVLVVSGVVVGAIRGQESVRLTEKARVVGDVSTPRFIVEAGAAYRGRVDMGEGEAAKATDRRASSEKPAVRPAAPRLAPPARVTAAPPSTIRAATPLSAPARVTSPPPRSAPIMPRPEAAAGGASAPAWAKKKLHRR